MKEITLALDWTPNINHIGFFIARERGFYRELGLQVSLLDPAADGYALTPAKKVELGQADLALCPTESVISYRTKARPFDLLAIAAIFQTDLSAIAVRTDAGIHRPRDLDGRSYASYRARYEDAIVRQLIRNDGGQGNIEVVYPDKLGIWEAISGGKYDATWIFENWEGAETAKLGLNCFKMRDYRIPYSYSPVLAGSEARLATLPIKEFLAATKRGYLYAQENPDEAVELFGPFVPQKNIDLHKALSLSVEAFGNAQNWGKMEERTVLAFLEWLWEMGLERQASAPSKWFTNAYSSA